MRTISILAVSSLFFLGCLSGDNPMDCAEAHESGVAHVEDWISSMGARSCVEDADCTVVHLQNQCQSACSVPVATAFGDTLLVMASEDAAQRCDRCDTPEEITCGEMGVICEEGQCVQGSPGVPDVSVPPTPGDDPIGRDDEPGDDEPGDDEPGDDEPGDDEPGPGPNQVTFCGCERFFSDTHGDLESWQAAAAGDGFELLVESFDTEESTAADLLARGISMEIGTLETGNTDGMGWGADEEVTISFVVPGTDEPVTVFGVGLTPTNEDTTAIRAYDRSGGLMVEHLTPFLGFGGVTSQAGIARVEVDLVNVGSTVFDDLRIARCLCSDGSVCGCDDVNTAGYSDLVDWKVAAFGDGLDIHLQDFGPPAPEMADLMEGGYRFDQGEVTGADPQNFAWSGDVSGPVEIAFYNPGTEEPTSVYGVGLDALGPNATVLRAFDRMGKELMTVPSTEPQFLGVNSHAGIARVQVHLISAEMTVFDDLRVSRCLCDEPADDEPGDDEPGDDEPGDDEPGDDEPGDDEPGDDEPGDDEPGDDEPADDEPCEAMETSGELAPEGSAADPLYLGQGSPLFNWNDHQGSVDTTASYYWVDNVDGGWWVYLKDMTDNVDLYVYSDPGFSDDALCASTNACYDSDMCSLEADGNSSAGKQGPPRYLKVDGSNTAGGAQFILNVQP